MRLLRAVVRHPLGREQRRRRLRAARIARDIAGNEDLKRLLAPGSSLGGARPKVHILNAAGRVAIAKFLSPVSDTWNVMAWEKVALDLARDAGVIVPRSELIRVGDRHARQRRHPHDGR